MPNQQSSESNYRIISLDAIGEMKPLVDECHSIILSGGTMRPLSEFTELIFGRLTDRNDRISVYSFDHVVPSNHVLVMSCGSDANGNEIDFRFQNRTKNPKILIKLWNVISALRSSIPAGLIIFVPSYSFLADFLAINEGSLKGIIIENKASTSDAIMNRYVQKIRNDGLATLIAVINGKLSEGINFSDNLARCVMIVGMPYPNTKSIELLEKIQYISESKASENANRYCEILCWKAINQTIGRAIRHSKDYASIVLLDSRYCNSELVEQNLPTWMLRNHGLCLPANLMECERELIKFYAQFKFAHI